MTQIQHHQRVLRPSQQTSPAVLTALAAASAWSFLLFIASVLWGAGAVPMPLSDSGPGAFPSVLDSLPVPVAAGVVGFVALLSFVLSAVLLTVPRLRNQLRSRRGVRTMGIVAIVFAVVTTTVFTDTLLLAYLGYTLSLQFPPIPLGVVCQAVMMVGPALWIVVWATAERGYRQLDRIERRGGSYFAGRGTSSIAGRTTSSAVSFGAKTAVVVAVVVPGFYALTRILWAIGIPFGLSQGLFDEGQRVGLWHSGLALALAAVAGILLTLGLVQRWGERFPAWCGPLAGRRVPITLATVPATIVSLALFTGGVGLIRTVFTDRAEIFADSWWATIGPTLLFPFWAVALGWATFAYRERRLAAEAAADPEDRLTPKID